MDREMNTALPDQSQTTRLAQEAIPSLEALFARGCYGDLTASQHEQLDRIADNNPTIRQAIDHYAANGCQDCGGRLSATDCAGFRLSCRPCRKLNEQLFYTSLAPQARARNQLE